MSQVIDRFLELVQIDSPSGSEENIRRWLVDWANKNGFDHTIDQAGNLLVSKQSSNMLPFFLCAHMDTVQPGEGIQPIIRNNTIVSAGDTILGADNKASLAAIVTALETWQSSSQTGFELLFTVREETGGGADFFDPKQLQSKSGFIFDYAEPLGNIVIAAPYIINFSLELEGRSSHACFPKKGVSVLPTLTTLLQSIPTGKQRDGKTSINIGQVAAGSGVNTLPGTAKIDGEIRSYSEKTLNKILEEIQKICSENSSEKLKISLKKSGFCPGYTHSKHSQEIIFLDKVFSDIGISTNKKTVYGISDANSLNALGLNVITVSDGVRFPHTTRESISISDLEALTQIIQEMLTLGENSAAFKK